jgi:hypothetical protein
MITQLASAYTTEKFYSVKNTPDLTSEISIDITNTSLEKFFNITTERINENTWRLTAVIGEELLSTLRMCYNNLTQTSVYSEGYYCNLNEIRSQYLSGYNVNDNALTSFLMNDRNVPITIRTGRGSASINTTDYLQGKFTVDLTFKTYQTSISIGLATITTFLPNGNGAAYEGAFNENTLTQDASNEYAACGTTCINQTNTSNDVHYTTQYGDASDDAYFIVNWTVPGNNINWALITMEGQQEDTGNICQLAVYNWTSSLWIPVNGPSSCDDTDVSLTYNISGAALANYDNVGRIRTVFYTNSSAANVLKIDFASLYFSYNASINFTTPSINDTEVFTGETINHSVQVQTGIGSTLDSYIFSWNGSGVNCDTWANSSWVSIGGGTTATISNSSVLSSACSGKNIGYKFYVNNSDNKINNSAINNYNVYSYGTLQVNINSPNNNTNVTQNNTFNLNATVTCAGGAGAKCGNVNAYARYNASSANPDTDMNKTTALRILLGASCLQGSANVTDQDTTGTLDGICGLKYDGVYNTTGTWSNPSYFNDGRLDTSTNSSVNGATYYINYSIPDGANLDTKWTTFYPLFSDSLDFNFSGCDFSTGKAQIKLNYSSGDGTARSYCYNTSGWLFKHTRVLEPARIAIADDGMNWSISGASNPTSSSSLSSGDSFNVSWVVNATGVNQTSYLVDVLFISSYGASLVPENNTEDRKVCIGVCPSGAADTVYPVVKLINSSFVWNISTTPNIYFNYTDETAITASCNLYFNASIKGSNSSVLNNTLTNITTSALTNGNYTVNVSCSDGTNTNYSSNIWVYVNYTTSDTCTCVTGANWNVNMPDHCNITSNCDITGYNLTITNGTTTDDINLSATLTCDNYNHNTTGILFIDDTGYLKIIG